MAGHFAAKTCVSIKNDAKQNKKRRQARKQYHWVHFQISVLLVNTFEDDNDDFLSVTSPDLSHHFKKR